MYVKALTPILNVSEISASFAWFEKWGWKKCWDWGKPPSFGSVGSGECEIFCARELREDEDEAQTRLRSRETETKKETKACGRRGCGPQNVCRSSTRGDSSTQRHAMECSGDAHKASGWARVQDQPG